MSFDKSNAIICKLKQFLHKRWANTSTITSSNSVYRTFRLIDADNNDIVSKDEFIEGIHKISGHFITRAECGLIYDVIDKDHNSRLTYKEFVRGLHKEMSPLRLNFVNHIFNTIDKNKSGYFTCVDLDYSGHPDVISGRERGSVMATKYMKLFLGNYNYGDKRKISRKEFIDYYTDLSMSIASDEYFISVVNNAYNCTARWRRVVTT